ncbi:MAG: adenylyl-sulfate kinase [Candidatus Freyarchaeota archaeon]|nr:adenylyl-sulfate kinase [Candidatus Jordarchaeia archaeon]MBS7270608.1 adenylyl-sulfate kinase [Candidatus Jordarchaeia archaeon]MBS7278333.1 adenylyl-sulfate kinase [Candidatus Jordarchaeia archaeon]
MRSGFAVWLTGLPASGKTTIALALEKALRERGLNVEVLDGDEVRKNLSPDLGFTIEDREIHAKRVAYVTKLLVRNGVAVIVGLISPLRNFREHARNQIGNFVEVWVKCPLEECIKRDPKGLYKKALKGEITDLTGIQDPYEEPLNPEVTVDTYKDSIDENVNKILKKLEELGYIPPKIEDTS